MLNLGNFDGKRPSTTAVFQDRLILLGGLGEEDRRFRDAWQTMDFGQTWQELPCPKWSGRHQLPCQNAGDSFDSFWTFEREIVGF